MFDQARAKTYTRGALCITLPSSQPVLYFRGDWGGNPGKTVSKVLAEFLAKGKLSEPDGDRAVEVQEFLDKGLNGLGFGCQILPGPHFTMTAGGGDLYGCAPGGLTKEDETEPLSYKRALSDGVIEAAVDTIVEGDDLTAEQAAGVRFALSSLAMKVAPVQAYQLTENDDLAAVTTMIGGKVESESKPSVGDWMIKQAAGEVMIIKADAWDGFGYVEI